MGKIYDSEYGGNCIGHVEEGKVYDSEYGGNCIGHVGEGKVYDSEYGGNCVGRTEGSSPRAGAAALLLLLT
jgi:hypothetical protein